MAHNSQLSHKISWFDEACFSFFCSWRTTLRQSVQLGQPAPWILVVVSRWLAASFNWLCGGWKVRTSFLQMARLTIPEIAWDEKLQLRCRRAEFTVTSRTAISTISQVELKQRLVGQVQASRGYSHIPIHIAKGRHTCHFGTIIGICK